MPFQKIYIYGDFPKTQSSPAVDNQKKSYLICGCLGWFLRNNSSLRSGGSSRSSSHRRRSHRRTLHNRHHSTTPPITTLHLILKQIHRLHNIITQHNRWWTIITFTLRLIGIQIWITHIRLRWQWHHITIPTCTTFQFSFKQIHCLGHFMSHDIGWSIITLTYSIG